MVSTKAKYTVVLSTYVKDGLHCEVVLDETLTSRLDDQRRRPDERDVVLVVVDVKLLDDLLLVRQHHASRHTRTHMTNVREMVPHV